MRRDNYRLEEEMDNPNLPKLGAYSGWVNKIFWLQSLGFKLGRIIAMGFLKGPLIWGTYN